MASRRNIAPELLDLVRAKLASSGLDWDAHADLLHMEAVDAHSVAALGFKPAPGLKINYLDLDGKPILDDGKPFFRLRYLAEPAGFASKTEDGATRYLQPPNTLPHLYLPANEDWGAVAANPAAAIIITEGELKAASACAYGFATVGLGGVQSWRALQRGLEWLREFESFQWVGRETYICFDSDYQSNVNVCAALKNLSEELERRGARTRVTTIPALAGMAKTGLDDYLVHEEGGAQRFRALLHDSPPLGLAGVLFALNERYTYVRDPGLVVDRGTLARVSVEAFKGHLEATARYQEALLRKDGTLGFKAVPAATKWIGWPLRREAARVTYRPGHIRDVDGELNIWTGWGCEAKKGDIKLFLSLLDRVFEGAEPGAMSWFLDWLAYPLQNPGTKLFAAAVLHGVRTGTGKTLIGYTLGKIYGKNFTEIRQGNLQSGFNEWAQGKQFILGDDITGNDQRQYADMLKTMITQKELRVNMKYVPSYVIPDCLNYLFTSNQPDVFFLEDDDRRFYVHEVICDPLPEDFFRAYDKALWQEDLAPAVFHWLLQRDLSKFNPNARALRTSARERMVEVGRSDLAGWVRRLLEEPDRHLDLVPGASKRDLWTAKELLALYDPNRETRVTANGIGRELARAGVRMAYRGLPVHAVDSRSRYYILRNAGNWVKADHAACARHITDAWGVEEKRAGQKF